MSQRYEFNPHAPGGYRYYGPGLEDLANSVQDPPTQFERALSPIVLGLIKYERDGVRQAPGTFPRIVLHKTLANGLRTLMVEESPGILHLFRYIPERSDKLPHEKQKRGPQKPPNPRKRPTRKDLSPRTTQFDFPDRLVELAQMNSQPGGIKGMPMEAQELLGEFARMSGVLPTHLLPPILPPGWTGSDTVQRYEDDTLLRPGDIRVHRPVHDREDYPMDRKSVIEFEIRRLQEEMAIIDKYGKDIHDVGTVIRFQRRWTDGLPLSTGGILRSDDDEQWYTYAVLKAGPNRWFSTGTQLGQMSWNDLVLWLVGAGEDIRNFQIATAWSDPMSVSPENDTPTEKPALTNGDSAKADDIATESG